MDIKPLENAMDRAERALLRIERSIERGAMSGTADDGALRQRVAGVLADLDDLIREAGR